MSETIKRELLKKITVATCECKPDVEKLIAYKNEHGDHANMPLVTILGVASGHRAGESNGQAFVRFLGQFKAIRAADRAEFISGQCILPGAAPDMVFGALNALGDQGGSVDFVFNIGAKYDATAVTKYVYSVEQVIEAKQDDPLKRLEDLASGQSRIAAPVDTETGEVKPKGRK